MDILLPLAGGQGGGTYPLAKLAATNATRTAPCITMPLFLADALVLCDGP